MTLPTPRRIAVCADDFGIDAAASEAILELLSTRRLHSTSVLVFGAAIDSFAPRLRQTVRPDQSLGLHFTLTEATPDGGVRSVAAVALRSYIRLLSAAQVRATLQRQLDRFEMLFGGAPAYIDGHEHVHQFPGVRAVLVETMLKRYGVAVALRCTRPLASRGVKAAVISVLGGRGLQGLARSGGIAINPDFAGVYALKRPGRYRHRMRGWLQTLSDGGVLMCHPANNPAHDPASTARREEWVYFRSPQWIQDQVEFGIQTVAFRFVC